VALAIARAINVELTPNEQARFANSRVVNPQAHEAYLKGRYFLEIYSEERVRKAIGQFEEAIKADPNFALPYTGLADAYCYGEDWYFPATEVMPKAKAAVEKALQLDDFLAEAHASLGVLKVAYDFDWAGGEGEFRRAIEHRSKTVLPTGRFPLLRPLAFRPTDGCELVCEILETICRLEALVGGGTQQRFAAGFHRNCRLAGLGVRRKSLRPRFISPRTNRPT
jgi:tetratricopeptide (TPR) repeat protein